MKPTNLGPDARTTVQECLGYLNFSSGAADPKFLANLDRLFGQLEGHKAAPAWRALGECLRRGLDELRGASDVFRQVDQVQAVLTLVFDHALPAYLRHHHDLLFHQNEETLLRPFFIGRMCEAVLQQGSPWNETDRIVAGALQRINDYLGYRPVAVLRTEQKIQPYAHEWVRPLPLYVRGAGAEHGRHRAVIERAFEILAATPTDILFQAFVDLDMLDELAVDPRAYDFDHPNNKRPNYVFGQWDLARLDLSGRCRRFVVQQVTLDTMIEWIDRRGKLPYEEVLFEAAAVLAGTMLMGAGISGDRPDAHDSTTNLSVVVQRIAAYRDAFYDRLLERLEGGHGRRLREEAVALRQPFGGVRQFFNQRMSQRRATQLQRVNLAYLYARMGHGDAATREVRTVPVPAARMRCDIYCRLNTADKLIEQGRLDEAAAVLPEVESLLHRAIDCGAVVDPWNILGFGGQYSLFPSPENSVHDHRIDELIALIGEIFGVYVELQKEAAASGKAALRQQTATAMEGFAAWWDKYATVEVGEVEHISGREMCESADHVAAAMGAWHTAGTSSGDLAFWRSQAAGFHTAKAYAVVVDALLDQHDPVAAMALLVQWLSQHNEVALVEEDQSFHSLATYWMEELWRPTSNGEPVKVERSAVERWALARKFLDYLEANAESLWQVPEFDLTAVGSPPAEGAGGEADDEEDEPEEWDTLFDAAYENVTYRDSTDDGVEGEIFETGPAATDYELAAEGERIVGRMQFLATVAQLWRAAALASLADSAALPDRDETLAAWHDQAHKNTLAMFELMSAVNRYRIPPPRGTQESLMEYDRRRSIKEVLLEEIIAACVETADAGRMLLAAMHRPVAPPQVEAWEPAVVGILHGVLRGDAAAVRGGWRELTDALLREPLLYVSLARGGSPQRVVVSRGLQRMLQRLLAYLPRLGLLRETFWLLETIQDMEFDHPVGAGAITEFDLVFEIGCRAIVQCLVDSSRHWRKRPGKSSRAADLDLIGLLEQLIEALLRCWLAHSRGVRLSVLETVSEQHRWTQVKRFIERYGDDLFSQQFMNMGNLRAILHEGVDRWLLALEEEPEAEERLRLLSDLDTRVPRDEATRCLSLAIEAVVENYAIYVDYNSTTTQSDRGGMLYTLLDFLRLVSSYDRVAWNLRPIVIAHDVLVRRGHTAAAELWREAVGQRTAEIADDHQKRFSRLVRKYGMRLPSIADRLGERFVRPLAIDRLRALVRPAIDELERRGPGEAVARLEDEIDVFAQDVTGSGFDLPTWLEALDQEVERGQSKSQDEWDMLDPLLALPQVHLSLADARKQVAAVVRDE